MPIVFYYSFPGLFGGIHSLSSTIRRLFGRGHHCFRPIRFPQTRLRAVGESQRFPIALIVSIRTAQYVVPVSENGPLLLLLHEHRVAHNTLRTPHIFPVHDDGETTFSA